VRAHDVNWFNIAVSSIRTWKLSEGIVLGGMVSKRTEDEPTGGDNHSFLASSLHAVMSVRIRIMLLSTVT